MTQRPDNKLLASFDDAKRTARVRTPEVRAADEAVARRRSQARQQPRDTRGIVLQNMVGILSVVAVAVVVAIVLILANSRTSSGNSPDVDQFELDDPAYSYQSPYTWTNLEREPGHWTYSVDGEVVSRLGIDVSEAQGWIDWDAVSGDGIEFAIIRLGYRGSTEGDLYLDEYFYDNFEGAQRAGIDRGVYFFSQAVTPEEAVEEAEFVLAQLDGAKLQYPIAFDSEEIDLGSGARTAGLSRDEMTAIAEAFCNRIEQAGYSAMVYGNVHDLARYNRPSMEKRALWWAEYNVPSPTARIDFVIWQYSNTGDIDGISTAVDMNLDLSAALANAR